MSQTLVLTQFTARQHPITRELLEFLRGQYPSAEHVPIEPPQREALDDFDENYPWAEAAQHQEQQFRAARDASPDAQLVYAGLAPIPLVFHLGTLLGQTAKPTIFQHHHQNRDWQWPSTVPTPDLFDPYPLRRPGNIGTPGDVQIRVWTSYPLAAATLSAFVPHVYDVGVRRPKPDVLASPADLWTLGEQFKQALDLSIEDFPTATRRHIVASVPVGAALVMGMQVSRTQHLPIQTWNFIKARARPRIRAIEIGEFRGLPRVLLLGASPPDRHAEPISSAAEVQEIAQTLAAFESRVTVVARPAARATADLATLLYEDPPTVLHLACHGTLADIRLTTQDGWPCDITLAHLERLLLRASGRLQCVVLAACYSAQLAKALSQSVPAVIGFEDRIDDHVARNFSRAFWYALVRGRSVAEAFADGTLELHDRDQAKLFIRPDIDKPLIPIPE
jgi:hypothetical protein